MKKLLTAFLASAISLSASALITGDGFYRVQNYQTGRFIYVLDDKGSLNFQATTAELGAIQLWKGYENTISDPATIIYVKSLDDKGQNFDLQTQGTGVKSMIDYPVTIYLANKNLGIYSIYGRNSGLVRYIGDATESDADRGYTTSNGNGNYHRWYFHPLTTDDSSYFGITPELQDGSDYYATLYADFPFTTHSEGMTAYTVALVENGVAYVAEIKGTVPRATPVIIKCSSASPAGNKLDIGGDAPMLTGNKLKGVYFNNTSLLHKNLTPNDKATMRVLGRLSDGSIGFVTSNDQYLPRNKAYLTVAPGTPDELRIEPVNAAISNVVADNITVSVNGHDIYVNGAAKVEIFNMTGQLVISQDNPAGSAITLPAPGVYVVHADNHVEKVIIH
ncbi:MAG: T9SS type A sorting domain-containing protein [Duncaniella sp.]|uniref:T9SS type A sorting domain-containing protein n=1 Tax=Duncaniella sp. TaxID=2518496 RepID=UPI0023CD1DD0|nr:T9SS type A sorting domain-containing protein [Duncaniella sp.]MDE6090229.1 T9SS type A sorting domain-containing protein [Duncaniella sp.]